MESNQKGTLKYNERLLHEALAGNKESFKELKFNAGAGDAEAQYFFAQYYARENDGDFKYWIKKAFDNHYFHEEEAIPDSNNVGMGLVEAVKTCFAKYSTFTGRATRSEYWLFALFYFLVIIFWLFITVIFAKDKSAAYLIMALSGISMLVLIVPGLAVGVRRLHDVGKSGWWMFVSFIPYIGGLILLYYMCKGSTGDNEYGKKSI